jgi:hypothetical protein
MFSFSNFLSKLKKESIVCFYQAQNFPKSAELSSPRRYLPKYKRCQPHNFGPIYDLSMPLLVHLFGGEGGEMKGIEKERGYNALASDGFLFFSICNNQLKVGCSESACKVACYVRVHRAYYVENCFITQ